MTRPERRAYRADMIRVATGIVLNPDYEVKKGDSVEIEITELAERFMKFIEDGTRVYRG